MNELALFAGAGGGILGGELLGWRTVCAVEIEPYPASILMQRQNDGLLPPFPIWDDIRTFDGRPWRGLIDVVSGGFPCQDISAAGKGTGIDGERSGLWGEMARVICEVRPRFAFVENSPILTSRGLDRVLGDLAEMGFDAKWGVLGANDVGAPHQRKRIWIVAHASSRRGQDNELRPGRNKPWVRNKKLANTDSQRQQNGERQRKECEGFGNGTTNYSSRRSGTENGWPPEPNVGRVVDGVAAGVDRLKALGNGQVPQCAAEAWRMLTR